MLTRFHYIITRHKGVLANSQWWSVAVVLAPCFGFACKNLSMINVCVHMCRLHIWNRLVISLPLPLGSFIEIFLDYEKNTVETSKTKVWFFKFLINRILQDDRFFFIFGFVRIALVFQSISDLILLFRSRYHLIRHHKSATCISQAASNANHCPRKADQCALTNQEGSRFINN